MLNFINIGKSASGKSSVTIPFINNQKKNVLYYKKQINRQSFDIFFQILNSSCKMHYMIIFFY